MQKGLSIVVLSGRLTQKKAGSFSRRLAADGAAIAFAVQILPDVLGAVVIGQLLKGRDVLGSEQADLGHVHIGVVAEHRLHIEVGVAAVVDVARHAPNLPAIHIVLGLLIPVSQMVPQSALACAL